MPDLVRVTYVRSAVGRSYHQKRVIRALGLRRLHYSRVMEDNPSLRGMLAKVSHLLKVEPVEQEAAPTTLPPEPEEAGVKEEPTPRKRKTAPVKAAEKNARKVKGETVADKPASEKKKVKTKSKPAKEATPQVEAVSSETDKQTTEEELDKDA